MDDPVEAAEDLVQCNHCNKEVAKVNLPMHEAHCQRFLCVCPDCNEMVPKEQLEEHRVEQHTVVRCKMCDMKMQRYKLPEHEMGECRERPQSCEFCELELPLSSLEEHAVTCGSRTERCPDCKKYVTLKDQAEHARTCPSSVSEDDEDIYSGSPPVSFYREWTHSEEESTSTAMKPEPGDNNLQDDQKLKNPNFVDRSSDQRSDSGSDSDNEENEEPADFTFSSRKQNKWGGAKFEDFEDQISTCPNCHLALPLQTLQWHEERCNIFKSLKLIN